MILVIDNFDSFTYNIIQALGALGQELMVFRNDAITTDEIKERKPDGIVISPGPGRPETSGITLDVVKTFAGKVPLLGVCLGHQAISQAFGAQVVRGERPVHGKTSEIMHDGKGVFRGLRNPFWATRYHSLVVPEDTIKAPLKVSAFTTEGVVMGVRADDMALEGVQFHPESIATAQGELMFRNFIDTYLA